jgi:hypothetical protein
MVVTATANQAAVVSVWGWDNPAQKWRGYFPGTGSGVSDLTTLPPRAGVFVCVNAATTITAP